MKKKINFMEILSGMNDYARKLAEFNPLIEPLILSAIKSLNLSLESRGLDAGCGIGLYSMLLADQLGPLSHVTGLDISNEFLDLGADLAEQVGLSGNVSFMEGDVKKLSFDDNTFDWAWSKDCVGYFPAEPLPLIRELARVVKPGGTVAILAWSSENIIPGHPILEARLRATTPGIAPFVKGKSPHNHFFRAPTWFREAGMENVQARTFAGGACAPLSDDIRNALVSLFSMRWDGAESELSKEDLEEYERLCRPGSPDFILDNPDYYGFFTYSMFTGIVSK